MTSTPPLNFITLILVTVRGLLTLFYSFQIIRLYYATTPCPPAGATLFFILFLAGLAVSIAQLIYRPVSKTWLDLVQIAFSACLLITWLFWGNLKASMLGALKGALGLTSSSTADLPSASLQEIACHTNQWSFTSFLITDAKPSSGVLALLTFVLGCIYVLGKNTSTKNAPEAD